MKYHVAISKDSPLRKYENIARFFVESDKSPEELEKEITEFNEEKGRNVTVEVTRILSKEFWT